MDALFNSYTILGKNESILKLIQAKNVNKRRASKVLRFVAKRKSFWLIEPILLSEIEEEVENETIQMKKVENVKKEPGGRVKVSLKVIIGNYPIRGL